MTTCGRCCAGRWTAGVSRPDCGWPWPSTHSGCGAGRTLLLVGAISGIAAFTGGIEPLYQLTPNWWVITWAGTFVPFACTMGFGVVAMRRRLLPRWNWLPIFSGALPVALMIGAATGGDFASREAVFAAAALISALPLLQAGMRREPEPATA